MNAHQALAELIAHVSACDKPVKIGGDELQAWQDGVLDRFVSLGLLVEDVNAQSLTCSGCEQHCFMPVYLAEDKQRAYIVCDDAEQQERMGRIRIPLDRLRQWQASARQFAEVVAGLLGLDTKAMDAKEVVSFRLGMLKSEGGRRWVSVVAQPLALEISHHLTPLNELIYFEGDQLLIDRQRIDELLNLPGEQGKSYTPDTSQREARKLATQAMYQDWHDEYLKLKQAHPNKTDVWYSMKISKLAIAQSKDSETIRKRMKKGK